MVTKTLGVRNATIFVGETSARSLWLVMTCGLCVCVLLGAVRMVHGQTSKSPRSIGEAAPGAAVAGQETEKPILARPVVGAKKKLAAPLRVMPLRQKKIVEGRSAVIHLENTPAVDLSATLCEFLRASGMGDAVVVVPDAISNALLVRASDEQMAEIEEIVHRLDWPRHMVCIRTLIVEVDRGAKRAEEATSEGDPSDTPPAEDGNAKARNVTETENRLSPLADMGSAVGLSVVGNSEEADGLLEQLRILQEEGQVEILARPQITTLDNQAAFIQVGKRVPRITGIRIDDGRRSNQVELENVGLILGVTPRVSGEDTVVMEIDLEMSDVRDSDEVVLASLESGVDVQASDIQVTTAQSTVAVTSGKTIVLSGMSTQSKQRNVQIVMLVCADIVPPPEERP